MLQIKFFVGRIGDHWEVTCTLRSQPGSHHARRASALQQARADAQALWTQQRVACEVLLDEDDGRWHRVAAFGELLDLDNGLGWR